MNAFSRPVTLIIFCLTSYGLWHFLEGFSLRYLIASIPVLLAIQLVLADTLESLILPHVAGKRWWFTLFLAPGTILHELSHLIVAWVMRCKIEKVKLFSPNPKTGVLGYVSYRRPYDKWVTFREFAIGFAPFFGVGATLLAFNLFFGGNMMTAISAPAPHDTGSYLALASALANSLAMSAQSLSYASPYLWIFLYLQFCFGLGAAPSPVDFRGAFTSLFKNILSTIMFLAFMALIVFIADEKVPLAGYESQAADIIFWVLKFTVSLLLVTVMLLAFAIPLTWVASKMMMISGVAKTIPLTLGFLTFVVLSVSWGVHYAVLASASTCLGSLFFLITQEKASDHR